MYSSQAEDHCNSLSVSIRIKESWKARTDLEELLAGPAAATQAQSTCTQKIVYNHWTITVILYQSPFELRRIARHLDELLAGRRRRAHVLKRMFTITANAVLMDTHQPE
jgi:hypothetical protein